MNPALSLIAVLVLGQSPDRVTKPEIPTVRKSAASPIPVIDARVEADALSFVRQHHLELATVLEALKPMDADEYRKAIGELSQVARTLADLKVRNPKRYEVALDAWKTKSRVELVAAQLAGSPTEEIRSQLRLAIEAKVDAEIRRQRFELEQAEIAAKKAREAIDRLENHRDAVVEARYRALQPKKAAKPNKKPAAPTKPTVAPDRGPTPSKPTGEDQ